MKLTNKDICSLLFTEHSAGKLRCNTCEKVYKSCNGYTNQLHHLVKAYPDYVRLAEAAFRQGNRLGLSVPDQRTSDIFRWIEWCVVDGMPVSFCERPLVRKNAKMQSIAASTLQRHIEALYLHVRDVVAASLPQQFGLVLDGWSSGGRHFVAILAVFDDPLLAHSRQRNPAYDDGVQCLSRRFLLLAFCPLADETDLSAQSVYDLIADTLSTFNRPWEAVLFLIGDNCSVNQAIGRKEGALSFIGCASHTFQLAVSDFLTCHEPLLSKIHALMKHLSSIKCRAALRRVTELAPVLRNATRWSSTFYMVQRYVRLHDALQMLDFATATSLGIARHLLSSDEAAQATELLGALSELHEVTKVLQDSTLTLLGARRAFDRVISKYPDTAACLATDAAIVNNPALESGIIKIIAGQRLSAREQDACVLLKREAVAAERESDTTSFLGPALKPRALPRASVYMAVSWVPPTSNECERFFSRAKYVYTDTRKSMDPNTLEVLMFLSYNRDL